LSRVVIVDALAQYVFDVLDRLVGHVQIDLQPR
jgi:hypothetical protein